MKKLFKKIIASMAMTLIGGGMLFAQSQAVSDFADKEDIATSQIAVMGTQLGDCVEYHITGTVTWDNFSYIVLANSVIVDPGAHLIIKDAVVGFPDNMFISVAATGKLTLQNTRLTNINASWWGLFIGGDPFNSTAAAQGLLTMTNSVIENATAAIHTYFISGCMSWANTEGGVVQATGSTFRNNGVHLWARGSALQRYFNNCVFEITENTFSNVLVELYSVHKVAFNGCTFRCNATTSEETYGISAFTSSFSVDNYCTNPWPEPCPTANTIRSSFTGLDYGIYADGGSLYYADATQKMMITSIKNAIFTNNKKYGAWLLNMNYPVFSGCDVTTGTDTLSTGLYLTNCRYYKMQNNTFTGHSYSSLDKRGVGIYVRSSRAGDHKIYRNDFYNLYMGLVPIGQNCDLVNLNNGLRMNCNRFYNGYRDIAMTGFGSESAVVASIQGHDLTSSEIGPNPKNWVRNWYTAPCIQENRWGVQNSSKEIYHASHAGPNTSPLPQPQCSSPLLTIIEMPYRYNYGSDCPDEFTPRTMSELNALIADLKSDINTRRNADNKGSASNARDIAHQEFELQSLITEQINLYLAMDTQAGYAAADSLMQAYKSQTDTELIMEAIAAANYTLAQSLLNTLSQNDNYADFCERQAMHIALMQALAADSSNWVTRLEALMAFTYSELKPVPTTIIIPPFKNAEAEQEDAEAEDFKLFPNPAQGAITFEYPYAEGATVTVEIYNLAGQLVDRVTMAGSQQAYRAEHLANSIYFATLKVNGKIVSTQKMVLIK